MAEFIPLEAVIRPSDVQRRLLVNKQERFPAKRYQKVVEDTEYSAIRHAEFSPLSSEELVIAYGTKVIFYNIRKKEVDKTYTNFKQHVNHASYRSDGKLLVAGDDTSSIQVINIENRMQLRRLQNHTGPVRCCKFSLDKTKVISSGDDNTIKLWDIALGVCERTITAHSDSVRTLAASSSTDNPFLWASGSYDGTVKLFDMRADTAEIVSFTHGDPVESVCYLSQGLLLMSSGGNKVKLWDPSGEGSLVNSMSNHMKTVTSALPSYDGSMIVTASLDGTIKWNDIDTFEILKSYQFGDSVLSLAISENDESFFAGLSNGSWSVRSRNASYTKRREKDLSDAFAAGRKRLAKASTADKLPHTQDAGRVALGDRVAKDFSTPKLSLIDKCLRNFEYQSALDHALAASSETVAALIEELIQRGAMEIAFGGRDETAILPILQFMSRNLGRSPYYTRIVSEALYMLLEANPWLNNTADAGILEMLKRISQKMGLELSQQASLFHLQGLLDMLMAN